ncbi:hypothetical protein GCM10020255_101550 [Rhodococcus baikonurensis]
MNDVRRSVTGDDSGRDLPEFDASILLDTRYRGAKGIAESDGCSPGAAHIGSGENQQVVAVSTHSRGDVVEPEQILEATRVVLVLLELFDQTELLVDEGLVPPRQRFEHVVDLAPQVACSPASVMA